MQTSNSMDANAAAEQPQETLLMEGGSQAPLRIISVVALAFAVGSLVLAALLLDTNVALGTTISSGERAAWAGGLLLLLVGFFGATAMYRRRVASRIVLLSGGQQLRIETPGIFGNSTTDVDLDDLVLSRYHEGDRAGEESLNTPWLHLQVKHQRSFVVPLTGNIPNKQRLLQVLNAAR